jgi:hypothetical protein
MGALLPRSLNTMRVFSRFAFFLPLVGAASLVLSLLVNFSKGQSQIWVRDDLIYPAHGLFKSDAYQVISLKNIKLVFKDKLGSLTLKERNELAKHLLKLCKKYKFDPAFILSMIEAESHFRTRITSDAGAVGLIQLMPATAKAISLEAGVAYKGLDTLYNPMTNLTLGIHYLSLLREKYSEASRQQSNYLMLAAYNLGPTKLDQLRKAPGFKPSQTLVYYQKINDRTLYYRFYKSYKKPSV